MGRWCSPASILEVCHGTRQKYSSHRLYTALHAGATLLNTVLNVKEKVTKVLRVHANHYDEVSEVAAGHICALVGLKVRGLGSGETGRDG